MTPPIFQLCAADAVVTDLLGSNPLRLYPFGEAPQGTYRPYAVWQPVGGLPENYLSGRPDVDSSKLQVDVYADTGAVASEVAIALRDVIELHAYITRWAGMGRDPVTGAVRFSFDVDWILPR